MPPIIMTDACPLTRQKLEEFWLSDLIIGGYYHCDTTWPNTFLQ